MMRWMGEEHTTAAVQRYLQRLAGDSQSEVVVRQLLERAVGRLHLLCSGLLYRSYPRLTRPPLNLQAEEMLSAVVERLMKAMRQVRPETTRQFFALATQHMRWELNDVARRLDEQSRAIELHDEAIASPASTGSVASPNVLRMLAAIDALPEEEREVFDLVRIQGMPPGEAAEVLGVSVRTVQRRVNRGFVLLADQLADLKPAERLPGSV
jgi:RNA polymerase sigma factor (sigma-70 family)